MNGRELSKTALLECLSPSDSEGGSADEAERKRWAMMVAASMVPVAPTAPVVPLSTSNAPAGAPEGWRPSVGDLTPGSASGEVIAGRSLGSSGGEGSDEAGLQRIQVRVNTEEFGEVSVIIERAEQGLRILMGAVDGRVVSALRHEAVAVRRAIENGGQTVGSFEIVRMDELGTNLAQPKLATGNRVRRLRDLGDVASGPGDRKNKKVRRLNLIG